MSMTFLFGGQHVPTETSLLAALGNSVFLFTTVLQNFLSGSFLSVNSLEIRQ